MIKPKLIIGLYSQVVALLLPVWLLVHIRLFSDLGTLLSCDFWCLLKESASVCVSYLDRIKDKGYNVI